MQVSYWVSAKKRNRFENKGAVMERKIMTGDNDNDNYNRNGNERWVGLVFVPPFAPALFPGRFLLSSSHVFRKHLSRQNAQPWRRDDEVNPATYNEIDLAPPMSHPNGK